MQWASKTHTQRLRLIYEIVRYTNIVLLLLLLLLVLLVLCKGKGKGCRFV